MDVRNYFDLVQRQYDQETRDNEDLFRRIGFAMTAILVVGTAAASLTNGVWIKTMLPRADVVVYLGTVILVFGALVSSIVHLVRATLPKDWDCPWNDQGKIVEAAKAAQKTTTVSVSDEDIKLLEDLGNAVDLNRARNVPRFVELSHSFRWTFVALCLLGLEVMLHAIVFLRNP